MLAVWMEAGPTPAHQKASHTTVPCRTGTKSTSTGDERGFTQNLATITTVSTTGGTISGSRGAGERRALLLPRASRQSESRERSGRRQQPEFLAAANIEYGDRHAADRRNSADHDADRRRAEVWHERFLRHGCDAVHPQLRRQCRRYWLRCNVLSDRHRGERVSRQHQRGPLDSV